MGLLGAYVPRFLSSSTSLKPPIHQQINSTTSLVPNIGDYSVLMSESSNNNIRNSVPKGDSRDSLDLNKSLASKQQLEEKGTVIAGTGTSTIFRGANRVAKKYGGTPEDWVKKSSNEYVAKDGAKISTHWVENIKTGQRVEAKTIIL